MNHQELEIEKVILGIDPGTQILGYGVIGISAKKELLLLQLGVLHLKQYENHYTRLQKIFERLTLLIDEFRPQEMALEAPFFGKNVQSMLKLGRAQGVAMAAALSQQLPVFEYAPLKVKQAVTGSGAASKEQVARMLQTLFHFKEIPELLDATDAVAVAVCHYFESREGGLPQVKPTKGKKGGSKGSWAQFLSENPDRKL
ncbi:crossover junction endodeoxyribonuclease RuvC [Hugenholtzia roseola]|uniref:crossover junction endodeoxyribonuclease RuvC n=1 Tax=Hugenholtzia roseola TaxID=1002 RepID=UPI000422B11A|nr:crossover junction endodeoxyribonuclease RuvC [Hugenholtzia roseola]